MPSMGKGTGAIVASGAHPDRDEIEGRDSCTKMNFNCAFHPIASRSPRLGCFLPLLFLTMNSCKFSLPLLSLSRSTETRLICWSRTSWYEILTDI